MIKNKKPTIIIILMAIAALGFMAWGYRNTAKQTKAGSNAPSSLTALETLYDFGTISMSKGKVNHMFQVTNPTEKDVALVDVSTSCMCTSAYIVNGSDKIGPFGMAGMGGITSTNEVIKAHETKDIDVVYDPNAHGPAGVGSIDRNIYLADADGSTFQLEIKALVTP